MEALYQVPEFYSRRRRLDLRTSVQLDQRGLRLGMWYWKDDTRTLEFRSFAPTVELKEKGKKGKAVHFAEMDGPASERNKNLDNFLMALLYYLSHYLEKNSLEKKPKSYMVGLVEKKEMALVLSKLEAAQKYLAKKYCILVLGLGMPDKHHVYCGKDKMSDTQKDWKFFESFFTFCTHVAWIVFRRQHLTEIEEEIGRLFHTSMFNIPRRKHEDEESEGERKRMTLVQFREKAQNVVERKYPRGTRRSACVEKHMANLDSVPMPA